MHLYPEASDSNNPSAAVDGGVTTLGVALLDSGALGKRNLGMVLELLHKCCL